jgi:signal transduction histidine kinase
VPGTTKNGAGLGLSIAREVVVKHQGEIGVISQLGQGSEFFFVVPSVPPKVETSEFGSRQERLLHQSKTLA